MKEFYYRHRPRRPDNLREYEVWSNRPSKSPSLLWLDIAHGRTATLYGVVYGRGIEWNAVSRVTKKATHGFISRGHAAEWLKGQHK